MARRQKTGGRVAGTPNKATAEIKEIARKYGKDAIEELHRLATQATNEGARVSAIRELLDRGYGKPSQDVIVEGNPEKPVEHHVKVEFVSAKNE